MEENSTGGSRLVKRGYLYVKRPPRKCWQKLKAWHKRYFVLKDSTRYSSPSLEMYEEKISEPLAVFDLGRCHYLGYSTQSSKFPYALVLVCGEKSPLLLAASDQSVTKSWLWALGLMTGQRFEESEGKSPGAPDQPDNWAHASFTHRVFDPALTCRLGNPFQVIVQPTEDSQKWGLRGRLRMMVCRHGVGLARDGDTEYFLLWPVAYIRQFRHQGQIGGWWRSTLVTLEVGRRCSTGEGVFQFKSQNGAEMVEQLKKMVELWSSKKAGRRHSKPETESANLLNISDGGTLPAGNSAPCSPSFSLPPAWRRRCGSALPPQHRLDYVIPVTAHSADLLQSSDQLVPDRELPLWSGREGDANVGRWSPPIPRGSPADCARQNQNEDEGYIEMLPGRPDSRDERDRIPGPVPVSEDRR